MASVASRATARASSSKRVVVWSSVDPYPGANAIDVASAAAATISSYGTVDRQRHDVGTSAALEARRPSDVPDDGDGRVARDRQEVRVILEQDDAVSRGPAGKPMVSSGVEDAPSGRRAAAVFRASATRSRTSAVEIALLQPALLDRGDDRRGGWTVRHLQVQAGAQRRDAIVDTEPVRDDDATMAPLLGEHRREEPRML